MTDFQKVGAVVVLCFVLFFAFISQAKASNLTVKKKDCETPKQVVAYVMARASLQGVRVAGWWLQPKHTQAFIKTYNSTASKPVPENLTRIGWFIRANAPSSVFIIAFVDGCKVGGWQMERKAFNTLYRLMKQQKSASFEF